MEQIRQSKNGEKLFYEIVEQIGNKFDCPAGSDNVKLIIIIEYYNYFYHKNL